MGDWGQACKGDQACCEQSHSPAWQDAEKSAVGLHVWDLLSGGLALRNGIFLVWTKRNGYAEWCWNRLTGRRMQRASLATLIEAGRSFIVCSGQ